MKVQGLHSGAWDQSGWCPSHATLSGPGGVPVALPALEPPVRMFLKASSTLVESKAEVSMKDKLFFSGIDRILPR